MLDITDGERDEPDGRADVEPMLRRPAMGRWVPGGPDSEGS